MGWMGGGRAWEDVPFLIRSHNETRFCRLFNTRPNLCVAFNFIESIPDPRIKLHDNMLRFDRGISKDSGNTSFTTLLVLSWTSWQKEKT